MSDTAYENAKLLAQLGYPVFPTGAIWGHESRSIATTETEMLASIHKIDPGCGWRIRCSRDDGIICLGTRRKCDFESIVREIGPLPHTWAIARASGTLHRLFAVGVDDPDVRQSVPLFGLKAWLKNSVPVPGSVDRSGEIYEWQGATPDQLALARLTDEQLALLPKNGGGVTSEVTRHWEWSPPTASY
ncbi:MAG TPA: hypothetical protein VHU18_00515 [Rhizomicrobium sp.]|jgi:hypothetical protein|nr:hypothetical protein [Rhizomicrobium sp.]